MSSPRRNSNPRDVVLESPRTEAYSQQYRIKEVKELKQQNHSLKEENITIKEENNSLKEELDLLKRKLAEMSK